LADDQVCDELIRFFKTVRQTTSGIIGEGIVDKNTKDSLDVIVPFSEFELPVMRRYLNSSWRWCGPTSTNMSAPVKRAMVHKPKP
jgi:hypothetical protein